MSKELAISASRHETRVAIVEDDQVVEVYYQREQEYSLAGSIHKGRVTRVLPGMQSAFVDIGLERDAFLYVSDNMVGSSKRFTNIAGYAFSLAAYATFDAGQTWTETVLPLTDTDGRVYPSTTDPAVAFDDLGNCYIVALPWQGETGPNAGQTIGMSVYRSTDGGRTWGAPVLIHASTTDDKQAVWADTGAGSANKGNVYTAWDDTSGTGNMLLARTTDHGSTWKGVKSGGVDQPAGTAIPGITYSFSPEITVASDGTVIIVWVAGEVENTIKMVTSSDGGVYLLRVADRSNRNFQRI